MKPHFTFTDFPCFVTQTFNIIKPRNVNYSLKYLIGILNSHLSYYWFWMNGKRQGDQLQIDKEPILRFPIRKIDFSNPTDKSHHDQMVTLVERMLALHQKLSAASTPDEKNILQRQITNTDNQIDQLTYQLYRLTKDEIKIIEETT